jgi:hypothetical protein
MFIFPVLFLSGLLNAVVLIGVSASSSGVGRSVLVPMIAMICYAILGAVDDWEGLLLRAETSETNTDHCNPWKAGPFTAAEGRSQGVCSAIPS